VQTERGATVKWRAVRWIIIVVLLGLALAFALTNRAKVPATASLPNWAPAQLSAEFQRAASVLKPMPDAVMQQPAADPADAEVRKRLPQVWPAAWELFGSLGDERIRSFPSVREVRLAASSLDAKQRAALDNFFATWRQVMKGLPPDLQDWVVELRKLGASEDLANVELCFDVRPSGLVRLRMWVNLPGGGTSSPLPVGIGHI